MPGGVAPLMVVCGTLLACDSLLAGLLTFFAAAE